MNTAPLALVGRLGFVMTFPSYRFDTCMYLQEKSADLYNSCCDGKQNKIET